MTFKEKIVKLRKLKGLTQDEFASAVGVSRQAVYKWECGQSYPEVSKLLEIKFLFGISIDDLLDESYEVIVPEKKKRKRKPKDETAAPVAAAPAPKAAPDPAPKEEPMFKPMDDDEIRRELLGLNTKKKEEPAPVAEPVAAPAPKAEPAPAPAVTAAPKVESAPAAKEEPTFVPKEEVDVELVSVSSPAKKDEKKGIFGRLFGRK